MNSCEPVDPSPHPLLWASRPTTPLILRGIVLTSNHDENLIFHHGIFGIICMGKRDENVG